MFLLLVDFAVLLFSAKSMKYCRGVTVATGCFVGAAVPLILTPCSVHTVCLDGERYFVSDALVSADGDFL